MSVRTAVLGRHRSSADSELVTLGTVPVTETWIVKGLAVYNSSTAIDSVDLIAEAADASVAVDIAFLDNIAADAPAFWSGWFVMAPGDVLKCFLRRANTSIWVSGAMLEGHA